MIKTMRFTRMRMIIAAADAQHRTSFVIILPIPPIVLAWVRQCA